LIKTFVEAFDLKSAKDENHICKNQTTEVHDFKILCIRGFPF